MALAHRFPTEVADVVAGIRWTTAHAVALDARADRVGIVGGSTGGHWPDPLGRACSRDTGVSSSTERFTDAYRRAGGAVELAVFAAVGHAFANVRGDAADRCIARMREFVAHRLA